MGSKMDEAGGHNGRNRADTEGKCCLFSFI